MPDDLKKAIVEAIAMSDDENFKRLLMLLLRVEETFIERVEFLADQMTVPAQQHAEDHRWIATAREAGTGARQVAMKVVISIVEKGALVAAGGIAAKIWGA